MQNHKPMPFEYHMAKRFLNGEPVWQIALLVRTGAYRKKPRTELEVLNAIRRVLNEATAGKPWRS